VRRALLAALALACAPAPPPGPDAGPPDFLALLDDPADLDLLAGEGGAVKHLLPVEGAQPRAPVGDDCAFQDTARFPFHLPFLNAQPGGEDLTFDDYLDLVLRRDTRAWWGGELLLDPDRPHPLTGEAGTLAFTLYTEDSDGNRLVAADVREVHATLQACAPAFADALAFAPSSNEQRVTAQAIAAELAGEGIAVLVN
jgi:hypothetical protein